MKNIKKAAEESMVNIIKCPQCEYTTNVKGDMAKHKEEKHSKKTAAKKPVIEDRKDHKSAGMNYNDWKNHLFAMISHNFQIDFDQPEFEKWPELQRCYEADYTLNRALRVFMSGMKMSSRDYRGMIQKRAAKILKATDVDDSCTECGKHLSNEEHSFDNRKVCSECKIDK